VIVSNPLTAVGGSSILGATPTAGGGDTPQALTVLLTAGKPHMNIDILNTDLTPVENPGLETTDPRLGDIVTLVQNGDYGQAAQKAQAVFEAGIFDVRLVGFFLFGIYLEQGLGALEGVFQALARVLEENWDAMGPMQKRARHAQISINWLLKQLDKMLHYEENRQSDVWRQWCESITSDDVDVIIENGEKLQRALGSALEENAGPLLEALFKIKKWLTSFQQLVYQPPAPEPTPEPTPDREQKTPDDEAREPSEIGAAPPTSAAFSGTEGVSSVRSPALQALLDKLEVFAQLIQEKNFTLASLVADDINDIIAHFDPQIYFPELFKKYSYLLALHISRLSAVDAHKQTLEWRAFKSLYKTDLDAFLAFSGEAIDPEAFTPASAGVDGDTRHAAFEPPEDEDDLSAEKEPEEDW